MEIENAIFQDLKNFGKKMIFKTGYGKVLDFVWRNSNHIQCNLVFY